MYAQGSGPNGTGAGRGTRGGIGARQQRLVEREADEDAEEQANQTNEAEKTQRKHTLSNFLRTTR
eukprot:CAMPEP_0204090136 /NCGR_PEP_ID=MMETSP0360-20130528/188748_1 /ASSEMBLY_ACC=CAM_ASM_000342 /TAXON_ID=268821 /ORGANISM="Scrippsiella Hangoei, Strain SHTV-5" /LENGTH=64 /DNA_ID=CAMNT_0051039393 /DNA_START=106 /DNA_END=297 /DNA_ORIENTATION=+